ncbi:MAG: SEC-C domain-containing protein [Gammaproteobacteria bacterium]
MTNQNLVNKRCSCGSGKKYKHCCINKKPRMTGPFLEMGVIDGSVQHEVNVSFLNGNVELQMDGAPSIPLAAYLKTSHDREKKDPKILNQIPLDPNKIITNSDYALKKYDAIFAIDTNTKPRTGPNVSISCCLATRLDLTYCKDKPSTQQYAIKYFLEFRNIQDKAENIGWMTFIQLLISEIPNFYQLKIGLIVDSELGDIPAFNNQSLPIFADFYLPKNIELIYASADKSTDGLVNYFMSVCEKEAKNFLNNVAKNTNLISI